MYLLLLGFGVGLCAAGVLLAGSGVSLHEGSFDSGLFTPGIVAAVGGLLLIGLGLALRTLQHIERALAARGMPRVAQGQIEEAIESLDQSGERDPLVLQAQASPVSHRVAAVVRTSDDQSTNGAAEKSPETARAGHRLLSSSPKIAAAAASEANPEADTEQFGKRGNGAAATRASPRLPIGARSSAPAERPKAAAFDAMWPKGPRPMRSAQTPPLQAAAVAAIQPQHNTEQAPETTANAAVQDPIAQNAVAQNVAPQDVDAQGVAAQVVDAQDAHAQDAHAQDVHAQDLAAYDEPVPISVLRSGVVDGMAYTLYSDGSIEAQLPQGVLRFGSITELRHHLEQSA